jgi:CheY-like chemotaxis protein
MGALIHHPPLSGYRPQHLALVLVVDDDSDLRQLTARILVLNGYDVIEAGDGRIGLGCLAESIPDLVILDLHMPVMDGWAFRAEQQDLADRRLANIPILLLTGEPSPRRRVGAEALRSGGTAHRGERGVTGPGLTRWPRASMRPRTVSASTSGRHGFNTKRSQPALAA